MPTTVRSVPAFLRWAGLCLAVLVAGASASWAHDPEASPTSKDDAPAVSVEPTASSTGGEADRPERVYTLSGATISWDLARGRVTEPSAAQAARLAESMREWMDARLAAGDSTLPFSKEIEVETLANGLKRARLPIHLMNLSRVHVDSEGTLVQSCSDADAPALDTVALEAAPATDEEWQ